MSQCLGESQPFTIWCLDYISNWLKGVIKRGNQVYQTDLYRLSSVAKAIFVSINPMITGLNRPYFSKESLQTIIQSDMKSGKQSLAVSFSCCFSNYKNVQPAV